MALGESSSSLFQQIGCLIISVSPGDATALLHECLMPAKRSASALWLCSEASIMLVSMLS